MVTVIHSGVVQVNDGALAVWWFWRWHLDDLVVAKLIEAPKASIHIAQSGKNMAHRVLGCDKCSTVSTVAN